MRSRLSLAGEDATPKPAPSTAIVIAQMSGGGGSPEIATGEGVLTLVICRLLSELALHPGSA